MFMKKLYVSDFQNYLENHNTQDDYIKATRYIECVNFHNALESFRNWLKRKRKPTAATWATLSD